MLWITGLGQGLPWRDSFSEFSGSRKPGLGQGLPWRDSFSEFSGSQKPGLGQGLPWRDSFSEFSGSRKPGLGQGCARISNCPYLTRTRVAANITNSSGRDAPFFEFPLIRSKGRKTPCSPLTGCKNHAKFGRLNIALHFK